MIKGTALNALRKNGIDVKNGTLVYTFDIDDIHGKYFVCNIVNVSNTRLDGSQFITVEFYYADCKYRSNVDNMELNLLNILEVFVSGNMTRAMALFNEFQYWKNNINQ